MCLDLLDSINFVAEEGEGYSTLHMFKDHICSKLKYIQEILNSAKNLNRCKLYSVNKDKISPKVMECIHLCKKINTDIEDIKLQILENLNFELGINEVELDDDYFNDKESQIELEELLPQRW